MIIPWPNMYFGQQRAIHSSWVGKLSETLSTVCFPGKGPWNHRQTLQLHKRLLIVVQELLGSDFGTCFFKLGEFVLIIIWMYIISNFFKVVVDLQKQRLLLSLNRRLFLIVISLLRFSKINSNTTVFQTVSGAKRTVEKSSTWPLEEVPLFRPNTAVIRAQLVLVWLRKTSSNEKCKPKASCDAVWMQNLGTTGRWRIKQQFNHYSPATRAHLVLVKHM